jgi:hypothetical protein
MLLHLITSTWGLFSGTFVSFHQSKDAKTEAHDNETSQLICKLKLSIAMERFYTKVNQTVHNRNLLRSSIATEEKVEAELEKKTVRDTENKIRKNATRAEYVRRLRADRAAEAVQITSDLEPVVEFLPEKPARISTKTWGKRQAYWESIADYYSH